MVNTPKFDQINNGANTDVCMEGGTSSHLVGSQLNRYKTRTSTTFISNESILMGFVLLHHLQFYLYVLQIFICMCMFYRSLFVCVCFIDLYLYVYVLQIVVCPFVLFLLAIVFTVLEQKIYVFRRIWYLQNLLMNDVFDGSETFPCFYSCSYQQPIPYTITVVQFIVRIISKIAVFKRSI